jgi:hypothetical protein
MHATATRDTRIRRRGIALALGLLAVLLLAAPAEAGRRWCARDPIVRLNGAEVQIWVAVPAEYEAAVSGPIQVRIATPRGVTREVVLTDEGFNGHGEAVTFAPRAGRVSGGSFVASVEIRVPVDAAAVAAKAVPVRVEVVQDGRSQWFDGSAAAVRFNVVVRGVS